MSRGRPDLSAHPVSCDQTGHLGPFEAEQHKGKQMQPSEVAEATARAIHDIPAAFMVDPPTYVHGAELGFAGADFYIAGRGGVLGDTSGSVVAAAFVFFAADVVIEAWDRSSGVSTRAETASAFAETGHRWARSHLGAPEVADAAALVARLGAKVVEAADVAGAPLFAGWRELAVPDDAPAAAHHQLNALRELRGAYHGGAVLGVGLSAREAVLLADPHMAGIHGWADSGDVDESRRPLLADAERLTNTAMARAFAVLDASESDAFAEACATLRAYL